MPKPALMPASRAARRPATALPRHSVATTPTAAGTTKNNNGTVQADHTRMMKLVKVNPDIAIQANATNRPPNNPGTATPGRRSSATAASTKDSTKIETTVTAIQLSPPSW